MSGPTPLFYTFHFYLFGVVALASALLFVTRKNPVVAAMWLVITMFCLAALFVLLDAQFIGVIQVLVYAGAIMVVFLFVVMLLNLGHPAQINDARGIWWKLAAGGVGLALLAQMSALVRSDSVPSLTLPAGYAATQIAEQGAIAGVAGALFRDYLLAFEITSVLLLSAIVGAVVLGKRRIDGP